MSDPTFPLTTDGPMRMHGGPNCCAIHDGDVSSSDNFCCCCDPCSQASIPPTSSLFCCPCVPSTVCFYFQLDDGNDACCRSFGIFAMVEPDEPNAIYVADFREFTVRLQMEKIDPEDLESQCQWRLTCNEFYIDETVLVDHVVNKCIDIPGFVIEGVTFASGCHGSISISNSPPAKIAFRNLNPNNDPVLPDVPITYSPCNCQEVAQQLCVSGIRHTSDTTPEYVIFEWNAAMGDRWEYCPQGLTEGECEAANAREIIYLRGDSSGNCYLELDFEQSGPDTNDWGVPPNSFDENNPHDIRQGMIAINSCGCGIYVDSTTSDGRYIRIHSGPCSRYKYICGTCRCVPGTLCIIVYVGGEMYRSSATWDSDGFWYCYELGITFSLGEDEFGDCIVTPSGDFTPALLPSSPLQCGNFLVFENASEVDPLAPTEFTFVFASGTVCGCTPTTSCGICPDRCGGPPDRLYVTAVFGIRADPSFPYMPTFECTWTTTVMFWERMIALGTQCGYIGFVTYSCEGVDYLQRVEIQGVGGSFTVTISTYDVPSQQFIVDEEFDMPLSDCDPYFAEVNDNPTGPGPYFQLTVAE